MGERTHTLGPWAAFTDDSGSTPHTNIVAVVPVTACVFSLPGRRKSEADVALIAAAPEMLEALRLVKQLYAYTGPDADGFAAMVERTIDAALSKASPHV